jgi:hypothetical protein
MDKGVSCNRNIRIVGQSCLTVDAGLELEHETFLMVVACTLQKAVQQAQSQVKAAGLGALPSPDRLARAQSPGVKGQ